MKRTLVLAAAALVGVFTASAQSNVYSLNIVGYVNTIVNPSPDGGVTAGFTLLANPLDNGSGNLGSNLVPANLPTAARIWVFDPTIGYQFANKKSTGVWGGYLNGLMPIPPGTGFFVSHTNTISYTNTFVGNVAGSVPGSITNNLNFGSSGFNLAGSMYPIGGVATNTGSNSMNLPLGLPTGSRVWVFDTIAGYTFMNKKSTGAWGGTVPTLNVGQGFFISNPSNTPQTWVQDVGP